MKLNIIGLWFLLFISFQIVLLSCNNGTDNRYDINPEQKTVIKVNKDFRIDFPKGCINESATIKIDSFKNIKQVDHDDFKAIGMPYKLDFSRGILRKYAKIFIEPIRFYSPDEIAMGRFDGKKWHYLPVNEENGKWSVFTKRFSVYAPIVKIGNISKAEIIATTPVEYVKKIIDGENALFWNRLTYVSIKGVYKVGGGVSMNGGSFILLQTPDIAENIIKSGFVGAATEVSKDALFEIYKSAVETPDAFSKNLAKESIKRYLKEYKTAYEIAKEYKNTGQLSKENALIFIKNQTGYMKLPLARLLYNRSEMFEPANTDNLKVVNEISDVLDYSFNNNIMPLSQITDVGTKVLNLMMLQDIGIGSFPPYLEFVKSVEKIDKNNIELLERLSSSIGITKFLGVYNTCEHQDEVPLQNIELKKNGGRLMAAFSIFDGTTEVDYNQEVTISQQKEYPYSFSYKYPYNGQENYVSFKLEERESAYYLINSDYKKYHNDWDIWKKNKEINSEIDITGIYYYDKENSFSVVKKGQEYYLQFSDCYMFKKSFYPIRLIKLTKEKDNVFDASEEYNLNELIFMNDFSKVEFHSTIYDGNPLLLCKNKPCDNDLLIPDITDNELKKAINETFNISIRNIKYELKKDDFLPGVGEEYLVLFYDNSTELNWREKKCVVFQYTNDEWELLYEVKLPTAFSLGTISKVIDIDNDGVKEFMIYDANGYQGSGWEERAMFKYIKGDFKTIYHVKDEAVDAQYVGANVEKRKLKFTDYNKDGIIDIIETIYKGKVDENYNQNYKVDKKQLLIFSAGKYQSNQILYNNAKSDEYIINENFDSSPLNSLISIVQKGGYRIKPGIKYRSEFQSECFGFGKSNCPASCFSNNQTVLLIDLQASSYVHMISFSYMELDGDWGSGGYVKVDGQKINGGNFGSNPSNDGIPDKSIKNIELNINRRISRIELIVTDITNKSEIFIDNLIIK